MEYKHTKFKYMTIVEEGVIYPSNTEEGIGLKQKFDKLGEGGWEIISVIPQNGKLVFLFKQATPPCPFEKSK